MKTFKEYLIENKPWLSDTINNRKYNIIDTTHAIQRTKERDSSHAELDKFGHNIIKWISEHEPEFKDEEKTKFLFYSKSIGRGIVIQFRMDNQSKQKQLIVLSVLPRKPENKTYPDKESQKVILETYQVLLNDDTYISDELNEYLDSFNMNPYSPDDTTTYIIEDYDIEVITSEGRNHNIINMIPVTLD